MNLLHEKDPFISVDYGIYLILIDRPV